MTGGRQIVATLVGFAVLWAVLDGSATLLGSYRGEYGLVVGAVVIVAAIVVERLVAGPAWRVSVRSLGLGLPSREGVILALFLSAALLCFYPLYGAVFGVSIGLRPDWLVLLPGLFPQGGLAEELVFRGFLFRHARERWPFWPATLWSSIPFVLAHVPLFFTTDVAVAAASMLLALSISFPLAAVFERSGNSIYPGALVHFVIQGSIKLVDVPQPQFQYLAIAWIALSGVLPWTLFAGRSRPAH